MSLNENKQQQMSIFDLLDDTTQPQEDFTNFSESHSIWPKYSSKKSIPTKLIIDFDRFIDYLEHHPIQLTKKMGYISRKHLPSINERLSIKAEDATNYSQQEYYPYIHFFYYIALAGRLIKKVSVDLTYPKLEITDRWSQYKQLTDAEKYFFLLETFWIDVNWKQILNQHHNPVHLIIEDVFTKLMDKKAKHQLLLKESLLASLTYKWNYFFLYIEWLGLWVCEKDQEQIDQSRRKNVYYVKTISLTSFAQKIIPILLSDRHPQVWNIPFRRENGEVNPIPGSELPEGIENVFDDQLNYNEDQSSEPFYKAFTDLFPSTMLQETLPRNERRFTPGIYTFKVAFDKYSWCTVSLASNHTMEDLHKIIINTFEFDDDHLYSFFMDGKKWSENCIVAPLDDYGDPVATEVKIGSVGLYAEQQFMYLYDYGDEWTFTITVEQIEKEKPEPAKPYLKERKGEGPKQYFYY